jgi:serine/threonine protein kinase
MDQDPVTLPVPYFSDASIQNAFPEIDAQFPYLGQGGFKIAYRVAEASGDLVLKILLEAVDIDANEFESSSAPERFMRELAGMALVDSPHIVRIVQAPSVRLIDGAKHAFYIEPFYAGGTLRERMSRGPLTPQETRQLAIHLLRGVNALWEPHRIVHRDIKPGNIVYDSQGNAVILDLGIALLTSWSDITDSGEVAPLTGPYAAPEQFEIRRNAVIDVRTDQFLIGTVLVEAHTGTHPFWQQNSTLADHLDRLENFDRSTIDTTGLDQDLRDVIARMLAGKPNRRFRDVAEPLQILEASQ